MKWITGWGGVKQGMGLIAFVSVCIPGVVDRNCLEVVQHELTFLSIYSTISLSSLLLLSSSCFCSACCAQVISKSAKYSLFDPVKEMVSRHPLTETKWV